MKKGTHTQIINIMTPFIITASLPGENYCLHFQDEDQAEGGGLFAQSHSLSDKPSTSDVSTHSTHLDRSGCLFHSKAKGLRRQ